MPRGAQFGYIFTSEIKDIHEAMTVAHELGHGRFKLYHTFDKHYGAVSGSDNTDNFMDYKNGLHVAKWQWDIMNDPALLVSVFEGDGKSAMTAELALFLAKPYWERAALVLEEFLDDKGFYDEVTLSCSGGKCTIMLRI